MKTFGVFAGAVAGVALGVVGGVSMAGFHSETHPEHEEMEIAFFWTGVFATCGSVLGSTAAAMLINKW